MNGIMATLTWRQMKLNRRRTVITILGVIVSVAMIAAVTTFGTSFMDMFYRTEAASSGEWHVGFSNGVSERDLATLRGDERFSKVALFEAVDYGDFETPIGRYRDYTVSAYDLEGFDIMNIELTAGEYPVNGEQCVVSERFAKAAEAALGDTISIGGKEYTIVGLKETDMSGSGITVYTGLTESVIGEKRVAYATFRYPSRTVLEWIDEFSESLDAGSHGLHDTLLVYMGVVSDRAMNATIYGMMGFVLAIILVAAVTMIYNSFAISVSDRSAQFGMMASIGATKKQRRSSVLYEAFLVAVIAIPFGLFFGYLGIGVTFRVVGGILEKMMYMPSASMW